MTEEEYRRRILDIEAYYDQAVRSRDHKTRMYLPYALDCMSYLTTIVEADFYGVTRPVAPNPWTARALTAFEERWRSHAGT